MPLDAHRGGSHQRNPQGLAHALPPPPNPSLFDVHESLCLWETLIVLNSSPVSGGADGWEERGKAALPVGGQAESRQTEGEGSYEADDHEKQPVSKNAVAGRTWRTSRLLFIEMRKMSPELSGESLGPPA